MGNVPASWPGMAGGGSGMYSFAACGVLGLWAYAEGRHSLGVSLLGSPGVAAVLLGVAVGVAAFLLAFRVPGRWARALLSALAGVGVFRLLVLDGCHGTTSLLSALVSAALVALDQFTLRRSPDRGNAG